MRAILTYHSVDGSGSVVSIDEHTFARHVQWLAASDVRVLPLDELPDAPDGEDAVAITFDDGLESFGRVAAPLLLEHGLPATLFVVTDAVGATNEWHGHGDPGIPVQRLLDWSELARLVSDGFSLGAHTSTHLNLATAEPNAAEREILGSKSRLARELGVEATTFAYPYGGVSQAARDIVAREFRYGVTTRLAALSTHEHPALLPRLDSYYLRTPGTLESWGTKRFRLRMGFLAGARSVRRSLTRSIAR